MIAIEVVYVWKWWSIIFYFEIVENILVSHRKNSKKVVSYFPSKLLHICIFGHHKFSLQL
jgi:hypothetical protein